MATKLIEAFVTWQKYEWDDEIRYTIDAYDKSDSGPEYAVIRQQSFEVEIPDDFDPRPLQIASLRKAKTQVLAEAQVKANNIDEQIQRLLCLEAPKATV